MSSFIFFTKSSLHYLRLFVPADLRKATSLLNELQTITRFIAAISAYLRLFVIAKTVPPHLLILNKVCSKLSDNTSMLPGIIAYKL